MRNRDQPGMEPPQKTAAKRPIASPWARYWASQHRVPQDSHLVSFGDKITYTFAVGNDVASIHYDQGRGELFYKGHKMSAETFEPWMHDLFNHFRNVISKSQYADKFLQGYTQLIEKQYHT